MNTALHLICPSVRFDVLAAPVTSASDHLQKQKEDLDVIRSNLTDGRQ